MIHYKITGPLLKDMVIAAASLLEKNKEKLNALNVFPVPDGDTGTNMSLTMMSAVKEVQQADTETVTSVASALSLGSLKGARGNSGVILSQIFRGFAKGMGKDLKFAEAADIARSMMLGVEAAYKAVMKPKEGTILTVAKDMAHEADKQAVAGANLLAQFDAFLDVGNQTLIKTPEMLPVLKEAGVVDAGGMGLLMIYNGFKMALDGEEIPEDFLLEQTQQVDFDLQMNEDIEFAYCTEFFIKNILDTVDQADVDQFRKKLMSIGDCVLVVGDLELVKVHVHTNMPGNALQHALRLGELSKIKIDNMREQHTELHVETEMEMLQPQPVQSKKTAMVAVASGKGIINIFKDFLVDEIITGGQTMNPSAKSISEAIDKAPSDNVFVFPNNKNIILAAEQAAKLSKKNVYVIPSVSYPQGISAVLAFNPDFDIEKNEERMKDAINTVKTGQVTHAVRDSKLNGHNIKKGEIIGIFDNELNCHADDIMKTSLKLLENMVTEDDSVITIFYGEDVKKEDAQKLAEKVEALYEEYDVELQFGGQPVYSYIFSVE